MKIIVQKFGGTSVSTEENRKKVIEKVKTAIKNGYSPVVVVSAMGRKGAPYATDTLLSLIKEEFKDSNKLAQDLLMCCGETISSVVMCHDLYNAGINAVPLTGGQAGIITDNNFTDARCLNVEPKRILEMISQGIVPVVTGFQGVTKEGFLTTLGRGGSDTSASLLGVALNASMIEIYTDVDGIMTADPRIVKDADLIDVISYNEVFQLADQGAKVIHPRAVEIAMEGNVPLLIKNTMNDCKGTLINNFGDRSHRRIMSGITSQGDRIQVSISKADNKENEKYNDILDLLAANNVSLDLINIFPDNQVFTINKSDKDLVKTLLNKEKFKYNLIEECSKISVIGSGMKGIPGVMARIIKSLSENNIEVLQTADSHMTIWCLVYSKDAINAINILHKAFSVGEN
ncbi:aspartate kinase [Clostridium sp. SM-530-WT-3G]|uniref:aspartate kinase n=1 Tax=Clostridium sp. SM-530-WT-3G TaxID=2725303 RepID=UPI00145DD1BF|nr:aspartate kinase [Clostridium sp. SM-530-WT-3G]NME81790.1 aspartate kinase [Clostridium sp. SM-530-WT-3G]